MKTAAELRNAEIACIKMGAKALDMDDATYRAMLEGVTGKRSAADLDWQQRKKVIERLQQLGARIGNKAPRAGRPGNFDRNAYYAKIEALLADMGAPWAYAQAIAKRFTGGQAAGVDRLEWVNNGNHFRGIVTALEVEKKKRLKPLLDELGVALHKHGLGPIWCEAYASGLDIPASVRASGVKWNESLAIVRALLERLQ